MTADIFTEMEHKFLDYHDIGRLATAGAAGFPHVVAVSFRRNPELDTIDIVGQRMGASLEFRHVQARGVAAFVVDDIALPWRPRSVEVRGRAEAIDGPAGAMIRIYPTRITSRGIDGTPMLRCRRYRPAEEPAGRTIIVEGALDDLGHR